MSRVIVIVLFSVSVIVVNNYLNIHVAFYHCMFVNMKNVWQEVRND